ncbi:endonuclease/exonuclease/phosphatase family protein [Falsochrobactrum shanghaiense]|nr:endonuclease/exonuclease/phosphatase family protein [Falsochrobactrum shanghaiense]
MRIMTYNIQYGKGRDDQYDIIRSAEVMAGADIVGIQEIESCWDRSGNVDQLEALAGHLREKGQTVFTAFGTTVDIHKLLPPGESKSQAVRRRFGNAILSRWPVLSVRTFLFPTKLTPLNAHSIQRGVTEAVIDCPSGPLRIYTCHLSHLSEEERLEQAQFILQLHRNAALNGPASSGDHPDRSWLEDPLPAVPGEAILMGDFNAQPGGPVYSALVGASHPHYGRLFEPDRFVDSWSALGYSETAGATLYRDWDAKAGIRIDYIMVSAGLANRLVAAEVLKDADASDHQPLTVELKDTV